MQAMIMLMFMFMLVASFETKRSSWDNSDINHSICCAPVSTGLSTLIGGLRLSLSMTVSLLARRLPRSPRTMWPLSTLSAIIWSRRAVISSTLRRRVAPWSLAAAAVAFMCAGSLVSGGSWLRLGDSRATGERALLRWLLVLEWWEVEDALL